MLGLSVCETALRGEKLHYFRLAAGRFIAEGRPRAKQACGN